VSFNVKIGMLVVATNKYIRFTKPLWDSAKQYFMNGHELSMFVFTNMPDAPGGTIRIEQEHLPWPGPTLKRYHIFLGAEEQISRMDYLYYSDADMLFVDKVGDEALGDLVATLHPGFYNKTRDQFSYETRPESAAYIPPNMGVSYFAGGFNGGRAAEYTKMAKACRDMVDSDAAKGIVPVWHDESCMNRYLSEHPPTNVLSPSYCYQEEAILPFHKRLIALNKNHAEMRS
jgi:histo-blood group ABO system transferase